MIEKDLVPAIPFVSQEAGNVRAKAPSNIALIKYWGKYPGQIPANPSISFTLKNCTSATSIAYDKKNIKDSGLSFEFLFEGQPKPEFEPKL
ncbi:MAG: diphosphomevalonate decarboxylase, partial [Eudoraea sp.]|nr:diphosphomevalonate decarboxylase [Eudoraea sp.]